MPYVTMNRVYISADYAEQFEQRFRDRAGLVDKVPGFIRNMVLRPDSEDTPYVVMTLWETKEAFTGWVNSDAFRQAHSGRARFPDEAYPKPGKIETFETALDTQAK